MSAQAPLRPNWKRLLLSAVARGASIRAAAKHAGTSKSTIFRFAKEEPNFATELRQAKQQGIEAIEADRASTRGNWLDPKGLIAIGFDKNPGTLQRLRESGKIRFRLKKLRGAPCYEHWKADILKLVRAEERLAEQREQAEKWREQLKKITRLATETFVERGVCWCPVPWAETEAAIEEGLDFQGWQLRNWDNNGCPWFDGKKNYGKMFPLRCADGIVREVKCFRKIDLHTIKNQQTNPPNADMAGLAEAAREYHQNQPRWNFAQQNDDSRLPNLRLSPLRLHVPTKTRNGTTLRMRAVVPRASLQILKESPLPKAPADKITVAEMTHLFGISPRQVRLIIREGCPGPNGKTIKLGAATPITILVNGPKNRKRRMEVLHYSRDKANEIKAFRDESTWDSVHKDDKGSCYYLAYVKKILGKRYMEPCPALGLRNGHTRAIDRRRIPKPACAGGQRRVWGYVTDDVDTAETALKEGRWDEAPVLENPPPPATTPVTEAAKPARKAGGRPVRVKANRIALWKDYLHNKGSVSKKDFCRARGISLMLLEKARVYYANHHTRIRQKQPVTNPPVKN